jgi:prepilin-type processing-associated H-X9-DG protein
MFVFRLSASGRGFHRVYLNQAQQAFLDGHVRAFEHMGGVPHRIRTENVVRHIFGLLWPAAFCGRLRPVAL